ncbi:Beta-glucuronosyltransferase GlcAT14B [Porphyridium purpureum]|uniref:Beta-glucuronosyltransferase GlcAT14B n=1 Tax=Porphyridium purpureum TaxID=35688 RepID=A0A5J4YQR7_PORPP|nr:Beta-glucuronosyltransferase GlcAT14B [Porphyridium purpureum]|eukprot:POR0279..scf296_7
MAVDGVKAVGVAAGARGQARGMCVCDEDPRGVEKSSVDAHDKLDAKRARAYDWFDGRVVHSAYGRALLCIVLTVVWLLARIMGARWVAMHSAHMPELTSGHESAGCADCAALQNMAYYCALSDLAASDISGTDTRALEASCNDGRITQDLAREFQAAQARAALVAAGLAHEDHTLPEVDVAFFIQVSAVQAALLPRMLARLYHPENVYVLHFDAKMESGAFRATADAARALGPNVHIMQRELVTYQGPSMIYNALHAFHLLLALSSSSKWAFCINLSAADYPIVPARRLRQVLAIAPPHANFFSLFQRTHWHHFRYRVFRTTHDPALDVVFGEEAVAPSGGRNVSHVEQLRQFAHPGVVWRKRGSPLESLLNIEHTSAEAWMILSFPFVQALVSSRFARKVASLFGHSVSSPEHYFSMVAFNHPVWRQTIVNEDFRHVVWSFGGSQTAQHPLLLDDDTNEPLKHWPGIEASAALFTRKMSVPENQLMDRIDCALLCVNPPTADAEQQAQCCTETDDGWPPTQAVVARLKKKLQTTLKRQTSKNPYDILHWPDRKRDLGAR